MNHGMTTTFFVCSWRWREVVSTIRLVLRPFTFTKRRRSKESKMDLSGDSGVAVVSALGTLAGGVLAHRFCRLAGLPPVLGLLAVGMLIRQLEPPKVVILYNTLTKPAVDLTLSLVGMQIGSHLNKEVLSPMATQMIKFVTLFVPIVVIVVTAAARYAFPELAIYAPLVGSIAVERSSPEAMLGITETASRGPFTSTTMCTAAIQDVAALVCFTASATMIGSSGMAAALHLVHVFGATAVACVAAVLAVRVSQSVPAYVQATIFATILVVLNYNMHSELLLSAVLAGTVLNFNARSAAASVIEERSDAINLLLFSFLGHRINIKSYLGNPTIVFFLFGARLVGLYFGGVAGGTFAKFAHNQIRWAGLVTQLAIALLLVMRAEEMFPEALPLLRAYGGVALCGLLSGPPLLVFALRRSGEAGCARSGGEGISRDSDNRGDAEETDKEKV